MRCGHGSLTSVSTAQPASGLTHLRGPAGTAASNATLPTASTALSASMNCGQTAASTWPVASWARFLWKWASGLDRAASKRC